MRISKQQVMYKSLPGKTLDFGKAQIARISRVQGEVDLRLNLQVVLHRIREDAMAWMDDPVNFRPVLRNDIFDDPDRFVLLQPSSLQARLFPPVYHCQNRACGRVITLTNPPRTNPHCPVCNTAMWQLRFVRTHKCGSLEPLYPPQCGRCHNGGNMSLDLRNSERIKNFRWVCRNLGCNWRSSVFAGRCPQCTWHDPTQREMEIQVHRANSTFYPRTITLLNLPDQYLSDFLNVPDWFCIATAKFLNIQEVQDKKLADFSKMNRLDPAQLGGISPDEINELTRRLLANEITKEEFADETTRLHENRRNEQLASSTESIIDALRDQTGVLPATWEQVGQEMLEAVLPFEAESHIDLFEQNGKPEFQNAIMQAQEMNFARVALLEDFPILTASYGFTRTTDQPNQCYLNPFPPSDEHGGRFPIYVDRTQADALMVTLEARRVCEWLVANGLPVNLPPGTNIELAQKGYIASLFANLNTRLTLDENQRPARMVFGLLHTLSHLSIRQASLLCGLDNTSLSEYLLPSALSFAIFSNHRSGQTIGALSALFEQTLREWFSSMKTSTRCIYDPVCYESKGNCHACTHLAETSCKFFNLNLGRAFLFGGYDEKLGEIQVGFFDLP